MRSLYTTVIFLIIALSAVAQPDDKQSISTAVEKLRIAMIDADKFGLDSLTADSLSYIHSSGRVEDKRQFIENIVSGKSDFVSIELSRQVIEVVGDVASVYHILDAATNDSGRSGTVRIGVEQRWRKSGDKWKLVYRKANALN